MKGGIPPLCFAKSFLSRKYYESIDLEKLHFPTISVKCRKY